MKMKDFFILSKLEIVFSSEFFCVFLVYVH